MGLIALVGILVFFLFILGCIYILKSLYKAYKQRTPLNFEAKILIFVFSIIGIGSYITSVIADRRYDAMHNPILSEKTTINGLTFPKGTHVIRYDKKQNSFEKAIFSTPYVYKNIEVHAIERFNRANRTFVVSLNKNTSFDIFRCKKNKPTKLMWNENNITLQRCTLTDNFIFNDIMCVHDAVIWLGNKEIGISGEAIYTLNNNKYHQFLSYNVLANGNKTYSNKNGQILNLNSPYLLKPEKLANGFYAIKILMNPPMANISYKFTSNKTGKKYYGVTNKNGEVIVVVDNKDDLFYGGVYFSTAKKKKKTW